MKNSKSVDILIPVFESSERQNSWADDTEKNSFKSEIDFNLAIEQYCWHLMTCTTEKIVFSLCVYPVV